MVDIQSPLFISILCISITYLQAFQPWSRSGLYGSNPSPYRHKRSISIWVPVPVHAYKKRRLCARRGCEKGAAEGTMCWKTEKKQSFQNGSKGALPREPCARSQSSHVWGGVGEWTVKRGLCQAIMCQNRRRRVVGGRREKPAAAVVQPGQKWLDKYK